ncbi:hypothetical protein GCM10010320_64080 [Streptomyces caelestis]|nr:hypothetical protein GCM10010320_64080 [Streptomyces caelestis]
MWASGTWRVGADMPDLTGGGYRRFGDRTDHAVAKTTGGGEVVKIGRLVPFRPGRMGAGGRADLAENGRCPQPRRPGPRRRTLETPGPRRVTGPSCCPPLDGKSPE